MAQNDGKINREQIIYRLCFSALRRVMANLKLFYTPSSISRFASAKERE
jgi:hypothetical protein